jgi:hypothetical protein
MVDGVAVTGRLAGVAPRRLAGIAALAAGAGRPAVTGRLGEAV